MGIISCIGSGNMGFALMSAAKGEDIYITDADLEKAKSSALALGAKVLATNIEAVEKGDIIFLAVKPQVLQQVLAEIAPIANQRLNSNRAPVFVSMAAGWSIAKIQGILGAKMPVVRIMPNTPALIGKGMIALSASPEVSAQSVSELEKLLSGAGIIDKIDERFMDAVTGLSGSGPAFVYLFIEALADGGVRAGLPRDKALRYAAQTVFGSAAMVQETGKHPGELKDMVTSPGGTTIAGIAALEDGAFRGTVIKAVEAAWKRSLEIG
ncbi:pyrroline-5-carboxylate reductase [Treponema sp. R80B11-R83G3]